MSKHLPPDAPDIPQAWDELGTYLEDIVAVRRETHTADLISDLIRAQDDGPLTELAHIDSSTAVVKPRESRRRDRTA